LDPAMHHEYHPKKALFGSGDSRWGFAKSFRSCARGKTVPSDSALLPSRSALSATEGLPVFDIHFPLL
jgi:hypothetical protein